jgi:ElaB/YqjD/DUF883 family membrane-anchored ribosome-binding protein
MPKVLTEAYLTDLIKGVVIAHQKELIESIFRMRDSLEEVHKALQNSVHDWRQVADQVDGLRKRVDHFETVVRDTGKGFTSDHVMLRQRLEGSLDTLRRRLKEAEQTVLRNRENVDRILKYMADWENQHGK